MSDLSKKSPDGKSPSSARRRRVLFGLQAAAVVGLAGGIVSITRGDHPAPSTTGPASRPAGGPRGHMRPEPIKLSGTVEYFNLTPHGYDSLMLKTSDGLVQLDFPPPAGESIVKAAPAGTVVQATALPEDRRPLGPGGRGGRRPPGADGPECPPPHHGGFDSPGEAGGPPPRPGAERGPRGEETVDHKVYHMIELTGPDGKAIDLATEPKSAHVDGTIKHLNYAHDGKLDGAVLDDGTFVHFGPMIASAMKLAAGQKVIAEGPSHAMATGGKMIDADVLNGMAVPHPPHGPGGPGRGGPHAFGDERGPRGFDRRGPQDDEDGPPAGMRFRHGGHQRPDGPPDGDDDDGPPPGMRSHHGGHPRPDGPPDAGDEDGPPRGFHHGGRPGPDGPPGADDDDGPPRGRHFHHRPDGPDADEDYGPPPGPGMRFHEGGPQRPGGPPDAQDDDGPPPRGA